MYAHWGFLVENFLVVFDCEDTDVYVLHLHFYAKLNLSCCFTMEGISAERTTIGIGATAHE
jgi:hypothetical protein